MARKNVEPGHVITNDVLAAAENGTALDTLQEPAGLYEANLAPPANTEETKTDPEAPQTSTDEAEPEDPGVNTPEAPGLTEDDSGLLELVVLKNGATFNFRGQVFRKGEPTATEPEIAERLVRSGYFERG